MSLERTTRRELLQQTGALAATALLSGVLTDAWANAPATSPTAPVALGRCVTYALPQVTERLRLLLDQVGGLKQLAAGKTVVIKVNLTGSPGDNALGLPASRTYQVHPNVALALATLLDRAGAKRIRFVEGTYSNDPIQRTLQASGWNLAALAALRAPVEYADTRYSGGKPYRLMRVPGGGDLFPAYQINAAYSDCDTYISLAKLKNHITAGVTLTMKNNFGITPTALYGQHEHDERSTSARIHVLHEGSMNPPAGVPTELDPHGPRIDNYRVPRHTVDAVRIRPIDLALLDGIETVSGGEGPWCPSLARQQPHLLIAGRNAVCVDAIATFCMGYDPQAATATGPFPGDNHLALAAKRGLGTNDPKRIDVVGLSLDAARHPFHWEPGERRHT